MFCLSLIRTVVALLSTRPLHHPVQGSRPNSSAHYLPQNIRLHQVDYSYSQLSSTIGGRTVHIQHQQADHTGSYQDLTAYTIPCRSTAGQESLHFHMEDTIVLGMPDQSVHIICSPQSHMPDSSPSSAASNSQTRSNHVTLSLLGIGQRHTSETPRIHYGALALP